MPIQNVNVPLEVQPRVSFSVMGLGIANIETVVDVEGSGFVLGISVHDLDAFAQTDVIKFTVDGNVHIMNYNFTSNNYINLPELMLLATTPVEADYVFYYIPFSKQFKIEAYRAASGSSINGLTVNVLYAQEAS